MVIYQAISHLSACYRWVTTAFEYAADRYQNYPPRRLLGGSQGNSFTERRSGCLAANGVFLSEWPDSRLVAPPYSTSALSARPLVQHSFAVRQAPFLTVVLLVRQLRPIHRAVSRGNLDCPRWATWRGRPGTVGQLPYSEERAPFGHRHYRNE
jgi:hypothetical protein